ncbi:MAG: transposase [Sphaerochaetaceae bacterium]
MGKNRRTSSESFKKKIAFEAMDGKKQFAEIASEHDIPPSMVTTWKKAFIDGAFNKDLKKKTKELEDKEK